MAIITNPVKEFNFRVTIPGLNPFLVQKVKSPDFEFEVAEHGEDDYDVKTAARVKVGTLTLEKLLSTPIADNFFRLWATQIRTIGNPLIYKKVILIEALGSDRMSPVKGWFCYGCWPQKRNGLEWDKKSSNNLIETIEFACDDTDA